MKRKPTARFLRMGCGEGLVARMPLTSARPVKPLRDAMVKSAVRKKVGGGR